MELPLDNQTVAEILQETGDLLEQQGANPFRVRAYRNAADVVLRLSIPLSVLVDRGEQEALTELPGIGESLASSVTKLVKTGRLALLERLRAEAAPESVLATIGGIGPVLAHRLKNELGVATLPELDRALSSGKLSKLHGFGEKRIKMIRESLSGRLHREETPERADGEPPARPFRVPNEPPVSVLLDIDREYRERVRRNELPRITPKRFNPTREAWLPILHTERDNQHFTALFSNTARAHELGVTRDWVVVYRDERDGNGQWTTITSQYGALRGRRIIRGRERECREHHLGLDHGRAA